jgi:hypothetical protein
MVNYTVGTGGDFTDIGAAILHLQSLLLLTDDYTITLLEDIENTTVVPKGTPSTEILRPNHHHIKFDLNGYAVTTHTLIPLNRSQGLTGGRGIIEFCNGSVFSADGYGGTKEAYCLWCRGNFPRNDNDPTSLWLIHDLFFSTHKNLTNPNTLFRFGRNSDGAMWGRIWNIRVYFKSQSGTRVGAQNAAFNFEHDVPGGSVSGDIWQYAENISVYVDDFGNKSIEAFYTYHDTYNSYELHMRNIIAWRKQINAVQDFNTGSHTTLEYCACSDNSLDPDVYPSPLWTNNLYAGNNPVSASDFDSLDPTSPDFLKIHKGAVEYKTGTTAIGSWVNDDFFGNPRPDKRGQVSIGMHEPAVATKRHTVVMKNGLVKNWRIEYGDFQPPTPPNKHTVVMKNGLVKKWVVDIGHGVKTLPFKNYMVKVVRGLIKKWTVAQ